MDIVTPEKRSEMMSGIRSKDTKPEIMIRKALYGRGFRYRIHSKNVPGKPDIILKKYNAVIFIHGCFWHGHACSLFRLPETRTGFWQNKIRANQERDRRVLDELKQQGWRIATIWECALKGKKKMELDVLTEQLSEWIQSDRETVSFQGRSYES